MTLKPRRTERCKAHRLGCWNADGVCRRNHELDRFLNPHDIDICLKVRHSLNLVKPSGLPMMSANAQTDRRRGRHSYLGPTSCSPPLKAHSGSDILGCYCRSTHTSWQNPCDSGPELYSEQGLEATSTARVSSWSRSSKRFPTPFTSPSMQARSVISVLKPGRIRH